MCNMFHCEPHILRFCDKYIDHYLLAVTTKHRVSNNQHVYHTLQLINSTCLPSGQVTFQSEFLTLIIQMLNYYCMKSENT